MQVLKTQSTAFGSLQIVGKELLCEVRNQHQAFALLLLGEFLWTVFPFLNLNVIFPGKVLKSLNIAAMLVFHNETYGGTGLAAAEAFEYALGRGYIEGRSLLVMKGTASDKTGSATSQCHEVTYHFLNSGSIQNLVNCRLRDHLSFRILLPWHQIFRWY